MVESLTPEWTKASEPFSCNPFATASCIRVLAIKPDATFDAPVEAEVQEIELDEKHHRS